MEKKRSGFDTALKVLEYLKARKCTTDSEMAARLDIPMSSGNSSSKYFKRERVYNRFNGRMYRRKRV